MNKEEAITELRQLIAEHNAYREALMASIGFHEGELGRLEAEDEELFVAQCELEDRLFDLESNEETIS